MENHENDDFMTQNVSKWNGSLTVFASALFGEDVLLLAEEWHIALLPYCTVSGVTGVDTLLRIRQYPSQCVCTYGNLLQDHWILASNVTVSLGCSHEGEFLGRSSFVSRL